MKPQNKFLAAVVLIMALLLVRASLLLADEDATKKSEQANWGWAHNEGNVDVILHVKMEQDRYTDLILPAKAKMVLPKGTIKVKVVPLKPALGEEDKLEVDIRPTHYGPDTDWPRITEPGKSRTFLEPTDAIPIMEKSRLAADVLIPPGASEPEPEGALPSDWELPDEQEKPQHTEEQEEESPTSDSERKTQLLKLNDEYTKFSERLTQVEPYSLEAERIREALRKYSRAIDDCIEQERTEYGPEWMERYRDPQTGKLPGGLLEDAKSRLAKTKEKIDEQKEINAKLEKDFEKLKQFKPAPEWGEYLSEKRNEFRENFIKEHGPSNEWDEDEQAEYLKRYNEMADKLKEDWEKQKQAEAENNRKLGKIINQLVEGRIRLEEFEEAAKYLEKEAAEQERQIKKISDLDGRWKGNEFGWSDVIIKNGKGASSFGRFEVQKKRFVIYYDFEPFSVSVNKGSRRYQHEFVFSGTWQDASGQWSGRIGIVEPDDKIEKYIDVIYEVSPGDDWLGDTLFRVTPVATEANTPEED